MNLITKTKYFILIIILIIILLISSCQPTPQQLGKFADCLKEKGAVMYGTEWCTHCKKQKEMFGDAFKNVNFVDCDQEQVLCLKEDISGYPTWKFKDGSSLPGVQSFSNLEDKTGCKLE